MSKSPIVLARGSILLVSLISLFTLTGCFDVDSQFKDIRNTVLEGTGANYEVEEEFGIGSFVIGLTKKIIKWADDGEDSDLDIAVSFLDQIKKIQIGNYRLKNFDFDPDHIHSNTMEIIDYMETHNYDSIVRNYEMNSASLIMVRTNPKKPEKITEILVMDISHNELSLVQLKGNVHEIVDIATREKDIPGMDEAISESKQ